MTATEAYVRVIKTPGVLYGKQQTCRKRRRCDGIAYERHWIEVGRPIVWAALPPGHSEIANDGWWHHAYCEHCAPEEAS